MSDGEPKWERVEPPDFTEEDKPKGLSKPVRDPLDLRDETELVAEHLVGMDRTEEPLDEESVGLIGTALTNQANLIFKHVETQGTPHHSSVRKTSSGDLSYHSYQDPEYNKKGFSSRLDMIDYLYLSEITPEKLQELRIDGIPDEFLDRIQGSTYALSTDAYTDEESFETMSQAIAANPDIRPLVGTSAFFGPNKLVMFSSTGNVPIEKPVIKSKDGDTFIETPVTRGKQEVLQESMYRLANGAGALPKPSPRS